MEKTKEEGIITILKDSGVIFDGDVSKKVRRDQYRILRRELTLSEWDEYFVKEYSEKELINFFFEGNRGSYNQIVRDMHDKRRMMESVKNKENPLFSDEEDLESFYADEFRGKQSTSEDHQPVIMSNDDALGTSQYIIEEHLIASGIINQFTVKGLQGFVASKGGYITADHAEKELKKIREFMKLESSKYFSQFSGNDIVTSTAMKEIRSKLKKDGVDFEYSNLVGLEFRKSLSNDAIYLGKLLADIQLSKGDPEKKVYVEKGIRKLISRFLGESVNVIIEPVAEVTAHIDNLINSKPSEIGENN